MDVQLEIVKQIVTRVSCGLLDTNFWFRVERDNERPIDGRIFVQCRYNAHCVKTNEYKEWGGSKYYLSTHMTNDEVIKRCFVAFREAVMHEVMEGFRVDNKILFNPHTDFEALLSVSELEVTR